MAWAWDFYAVIAFCGGVLVGYGFCLAIGWRES